MRQILSSITRPNVSNHLTTDSLKSFGLFTEIITWKLRFFVPINTDGVAVLDRLLDAYPIVRIAEREAA